MRAGLRRYRSILASLRKRAVFWCHKHTHEWEDDDDGNTRTYIADAKDRMCAGAIAYQEQHHCTSQYQQVCERLDDLRARKERGSSPTKLSSRSSRPGSTPTS